MMRRITGLFIALLAFTFQINAQSLTENEIIGRWSVVEVKVLTRLPEGIQKTIDQLKEAFLRSKFEFKNDNSFTFDFELNKMRIQNGHWKYNDNTKSFIIQDWKDKDSGKWKLMEIFTKKEVDKITFQIHDLFIELTMNKEY
jgi:hypothetical protein